MKSLSMKGTDTTPSPCVTDLSQTPEPEKQGWYLKDRNAQRAAADPPLYAIRTCETYTAKETDNGALCGVLEGGLPRDWKRILRKALNLGVEDSLSNIAIVGGGAALFSKGKGGAGSRALKSIAKAGGAISKEVAVKIKPPKGAAVKGVKATKMVTKTTYLSRFAAKRSIQGTRSLAALGAGSLVLKGVLTGAAIGVVYSYLTRELYQDIYKCKTRAPGDLDLAEISAAERNGSETDSTSETDFEVDAQSNVETESDSEAETDAETDVESESETDSTTSKTGESDRNRSRGFLTKLKMWF